MLNEYKLHYKQLEDGHSRFSVMPLGALFEKLVPHWGMEGTETADVIHVEVGHQLKHPVPGTWLHWLLLATQASALFDVTHAFS